MADPEKIAELVARRVADVLDPLRLEIDRWPPEFRKIMWDAVAHHATLLAAESK